MGTFNLRGLTALAGQAPSLFRDPKGKSQIDRVRKACQMVVWFVFLLLSLLILVLLLRLLVMLLILLILAIILTIILLLSLFINITIKYYDVRTLYCYCHYLSILLLSTMM